MYYVMQCVVYTSLDAVVTLFYTEPCSGLFITPLGKPLKPPLLPGLIVCRTINWPDNIS